MSIRNGTTRTQKRADPAIGEWRPIDACRVPASLQCDAEENQGGTHRGSRVHGFARLSLSREPAFRCDRLALQLPDRDSRNRHRGQLDYSARRAQCTTTRCCSVHPRSHGGPVQISDDGYIQGTPELAVEVCTTSASIDLGPKMTAYARNGIREYIVWCTYDESLDWFVLRNGVYEAQCNTIRAESSAAKCFPVCGWMVWRCWNGKRDQG